MCLANGTLTRTAARSAVVRSPADSRKNQESGVHGACPLCLPVAARILERQKMLQTSQVLSRRLCVSCAAVLPFKDSEGGTWPLQPSDFERTYICRHAPVKKDSQ